MKILLLAAVVLTASIADAQEYISVKKFFVRKGIQHYLKKSGFTNSTMKETDSTLLISLNEAGMANLSFTYLFDGKNKCVEEKLIADNCDSCFNKLNGEVLANKKWGWQKLSENLYVSQYSKRLLLRINKAGSTGERTIYYTNWNRKEYDALLSTKN